MSILTLFLMALFFQVYFLKYYWIYERKLENATAKVNQINEKLIEIMELQIINPIS